MKAIGFARTAINDRDLDAQLQALKDYRCDVIFCDSFEETDHTLDQLELSEVLKKLEAGDVLVVTHLHRLGKSTRQLTELTGTFEKEGIHLVSLQERIDTREAQGLYFKLMDALADMECSLIKERTLTGLDEARKKGKVGGRPKINSEKVKQIRDLYYEKKETIQHISNVCEVSVGTCYKYINLPDEDVAKLLG